MAAAPAWSQLPHELIQLLGWHLDSKGWAAARSVCQSWRANITADIKLLEVDLERDAHRWMMVLTCVARLFPRLSSVVLLVGNRISQTVLSERLASLAITSIRLQELELRFIYCTNPLLGGWLDDLGGVTELRQLRALRLAGGATPPPAFFERLSVLRQLSVLEFLPGIYGQMAGLDMPVTSVDADNMPASEGGVNDTHLAAIGQLTQLRQLTVKVCPADTTADGLAGLAAHGLLERLELLSLYDSELPSHSLPDGLAAAAALTHLQVGLCNVDDLSPLARLPRIQALSLDTVYLPDLRELVTAAARSNIPPAGPGAITGLCLLDQVVAGASQLASLTQLASLAELVVVNPMADAAAAAAAAGAAAAPAAAAANGEQQQAQHVDMAVLAGLHSLRLLQVDLLQHGPQAAAPAPGEAGGGVQQPQQQQQQQQQQPLALSFSAASVRELAAGWTGLLTLDLSGFGPDLLPEEVVAGFSALRTLKYLSITSPEAGPGAGAAAAAAPTGGAGAGGRSAAPQRRLAWWQLPRGLSSLCLGHFDLSQRSGGGTASLCGGGAGCCMSAERMGRPGRQQPAAVQGLTLSRMQQLILPGGGSPLRAKRRRSAQQAAVETGELLAEPSSASSSVTGAWSARGSSSGGSSGGGAVVSLAPACACVARLRDHFSSLQALWLEACVLPPHFVPAVQAPLLESLSLLHVRGTTPGDLAAISSLTGLTSLRCIPADHAGGGLRHLLPLRHLKKLNVKLTHLQPADLGVLRQLRSLFCLALSAPAVDGQLLPGFPSAVRLPEVVDLVRDCLPYCDVELQPEPNLSNLY